MAGKWFNRALVVALCGFSVGVGIAIERGLPEIEIEEDAPVKAVYEDPDWRLALDEVRKTADAGTMRAGALDVLNEAEADKALVEAITMLGWVATDDDLELLTSFAMSSDQVISRPGIIALGRLGTDGAIDTLLELTDDHKTAGRAIEALGLTGHPRAFEALDVMLDNPRHCNWAAHAIGAFESELAAERLSLRFHGADRNMARAVATVLAGFPDDVPSARQILYDTVDNALHMQRDAALSALAESGDPMVYAILLDDLRTGSATRQGRAATALGQLGDPRAIPHLRNVAMHGHRNSRHSALNALANIGVPKATAALLDIIDVGAADIGSQAVYAVPDVEKEHVWMALIRASENRPKQVREAVASKLYSASWMPRQVPAEVLELARTEITVNLRSNRAGQALAFLLSHGTLEDELLVEAVLLDGPPTVRSQAVWNLQNDPSKMATDLLIGMIDDPDNSVRQAAVSALMQRGGSEDLLQERLMDQLANSPFQDYGSAEQALIDIGTPEAVGAVVARIENGTQREWTNAINAMANSGSSDHVKTLVGILDTAEEPALRQQIYSSLLYSGTTDLEEIVDRAAAEEDPQLTTMAAQALGRMGTEDSRKRLLDMTHSGEPQSKVAAVQALAQIGGDEAEARIISALDDPDLASTAASSLTQLGTEEARQAMLDLAQDPERDTSLRTQVMYNLAWNGGAEGREVLSDALFDDDSQVRNTAISALESMGTSQAAEPLAALLDADPDDEDAMADAKRAAQALQRMGGTTAEANGDLIDELIAPQGGPGDTDALIYFE